MGTQEILLVFSLKRTKIHGIYLNCMGDIPKYSCYQELCPHHFTYHISPQPWQQESLLSPYRMYPLRSIGTNYFLLVVVNKPSPEILHQHWLNT
jgi:hypothetical protein